MDSLEDWDIDYVAQLARLALTDEEKAIFSRQLAQVLGYMEKLNTVDTEGVEPMAHAFPLNNVLETDRVREAFSSQEALQNAPQQRDGQLVVPKVVEGA